MDNQMANDGPHTTIFQVSWETHQRRSDGQVDPVVKDKGVLVFEVSGINSDDSVKKANELVNHLKEKVRSTHGNTSGDQKTESGASQVRWLGGTQPQQPALLAVREVDTRRDGDGT